MNDKFDVLTKSMAQSGTRRQALKKFGVGLAGMALACFGLAPKSHGGGSKPNLSATCQSNRECVQRYGNPSAVCCKVSISEGLTAKFCVFDKSYCLNG